ncbi:MAG: glutathione S-transferase N-terminal domain-containing protein [Pseudomonadota bacterium]
MHGDLGDGSSPRSGGALANFPITERWAPSHLDRLQLYSHGTPNGVKVSIALEELRLPYEVHRVPLSDEYVKSPEFLSLSPNNKIPAIIDPDGPGGEPIGLFESGAILIYLAAKTGRLAGSSEAERYEILQWLFFQVGGVGPMLGQFGFFHAFGGKDIEDPRPRDRYLNETRRLLNVIDGRLEGREWIAGDYSIADIALGPWLETIERFYKAEEITGYDFRPRVVDYVARFKTRPAVMRGWSVLSGE